MGIFQCPWQLPHQWPYFPIYVPLLELAVDLILLRMAIRREREIVSQPKTIPISPNTRATMAPSLPENAFKHGTGYVDQPFIDINLTARQGVMVFQVKNKFDLDSDASKDESSGIGLNNVRSRLKLLYPGRHELVIRTDNSLASLA